MSSSSTQLIICNLALRHLGMKKLSNLSGTDPVTVSLNDFFDSTRDDILREHRWSWATVKYPLVVLDNVLDDWAYVYAYPDDCLTVWNVYNVATVGDKDAQDFEQILLLAEVPNTDIWLNSTAYIEGDFVTYNSTTAYLCILANTNKNPTTQTDYWVVQTKRLVILTDLTDAIAEYTFRNNDITMWDDKFIMALSYRLAAQLAHFNLGDAEKGLKLMEVSNGYIAEAKRIAASEKPKKPKQESSYQSSR